MAALNLEVVHFVYVVESTGELLRNCDKRVVIDALSPAWGDVQEAADINAAIASALIGKPFVAARYKPDPSYCLI